MIFDAEKLLSKTVKVAPMNMSSVDAVFEPRQFDGLCSIALGLAGRRLAVTTVQYWDGAERPSLNRLLVFDTAAGRWMWESKIDFGWKLGFDMTTAVFSADGSMLAVAGPKKLVLFDVETARQIRTFEEHKGSIDEFFFTRDGRRLIVANQDGTNMVWDSSND
jgi:WD40 repeat protein